MMEADADEVLHETETQFEHTSPAATEIKGNNINNQSKKDYSITTQAKP